MSNPTAAGGKKFKWFATAGSLALAMPAIAFAAVEPATAQEKTAGPAVNGGQGVETVIITANKRPEDIQEVAMSVSAVGGDTLEKLGTANITEISKLVPGLQIATANVSRNTTVTIRGVGTSGTNVGIEPSVGIFLDGVYQPLAGPIQGNLLDIAAVEVLRGPQGTLYGRNTSVGALNITTRDPTQKFEAMLQGGVGNFQEEHMNGYVGGAITNNISGRLSFWQSSHDGYQYNLADGSRTNDNNQYGVRGRLKWQPTDNFTDNVIGYYSHALAHCCSPDQINPFGTGGIATAGFLAGWAATGHPYTKTASLDNTVVEGAPGTDKFESYGGSNQADYKLGEYTLTSITAFNGWLAFNNPTAAASLPLNVTNNIQKTGARTLSEELRVASPVGHVIDFLAGVYLFNEDLSYIQLFSPGPGATRVFPGGLGKVLATDNYTYDFTQNTTSEAVFGQATWNVTKKARITAGLRYGQEDKKADTYTINNPTASAAWKSANSGGPLTHLTDSGDKLTWMATAQYDVTDTAMAYLLASTGFKSGGFNARSNAPAGFPLTFNPENSLNYEVGLKSSWFHHSVVVNADFYELLEKGLQQSLLNPLTGSGFVVGNAGNTKNDGFEADVQWRPIEQLHLTGGTALNSTKIYGYEAAPCATYPGTIANGTKPGTCNLDGRRPAYNPATTYNFSAEWRQPVGTGYEGFALVNGSYTGAQSLDATLDPRSHQASYTLINGRLGITGGDGRWTVAVYGKNMTNEVYYTAASTQPVAAYVTGGGTAAAAGFVGWYGQPRTYGVEADVRF